MKNMSEFQLVAKVECSNPRRYKCVPKLVILNPQEEVDLRMTRLGGGIEGQLGEASGTGTNQEETEVVELFLELRKEPHWVYLESLAVHNNLTIITRADWLAFL